MPSFAAAASAPRPRAARAVELQPAAVDLRRRALPGAARAHGPRVRPRGRCRRPRAARPARRRRDALGVEQAARPRGAGDGRLLRGPRRASPRARVARRAATRVSPARRAGAVDPAPRRGGARRGPRRRPHRGPDVGRGLLRDVGRGRVGRQGPRRARAVAAPARAAAGPRGGLGAQGLHDGRAELHARRHGPRPRDVAHGGLRAARPPPPAAADARSTADAPPRRTRSASARTSTCRTATRSRSSSRRVTRPPTPRPARPRRASRRRTCSSATGSAPRSACPRSKLGPDTL